MAIRKMAIRISEEEEKKEIWIIRVTFLSIYGILGFCIAVWSSFFINEFIDLAKEKEHISRTCIINTFKRSNNIE
ncbi:hypothetical protein ES332_A09G020600v1 [Gossypium tomentosum]|uniref:Uncharacterized protein n=1 Tax=Gossypium tomentosum TaxID=34277 RepID=A0A5D2NXB8_GOSTO|nr:hypothetical protein ES332_A09G020600v1 [Gossypium tomentosum]